MSTEQSVIHDIGYQRYAGARLGRWYAVRSLYTHALRTCFGLGRSVKAKIFPWFVVGIVVIVAAVVTAVRSQFGEVVLTYPAFSDAVSFLLILFCAAVAPELVSRDLRTGVLPLYFSRPLNRSDYALAKLAALISAVWLTLLAPLLVMFIGGAFSVDGLRAVWDEFLDFLPGLAYAGIYAILFSVISLLVASLASRRAVAAAVIVATFLVTTPVVGVLGIAGGDAQYLAFIASPFTLVQGIGVWLFEIQGFDIGSYGPTYGLAAAFLVGLCTMLLVARYRKVAQ
jgi:ABC-2 type transport system permease protein